MSRCWNRLGFAAVVICIGGCHKTQQPASRSLTDSLRSNRANDLPGLAHVLTLEGGIVSGGEPAGDAGFASLKRLGVKTIVSVDGATPDVERARKYGIEYIHIPIGYDGVSPAAAAALTRVVRDRPGPYYVHCHHGKHRGPAAAAVMCIAAGVILRAEAHSILEVAGTSRDYQGLWRDVAAFEPPSPGTSLPPLVAMAQVESLAATMARIDRIWDNLKLCKNSRWNDPPDHPDIAAMHEALLLREAFREAGRLQALHADDDFRKALGEAESLAQTLENSLRGKNPRDADARFQSLEHACNACHAQHRN